MNKTKWSITFIGFAVILNAINSVLLNSKIKRLDSRIDTLRPHLTIELTNSTPNMFFTNINLRVETK